MQIFTRTSSRLLSALLGASLAVIANSPPAAAQEAYKLGIQDKLRVRVVEWQTVDGVFREWTAVSGDYTVGASGSLSIPFVGETPVAGKTTAEVAALVAETLQRKFGLADKPEASVEMAEYRPIYISGDVRTPGQYPYSPNLNVVKAVSVAGGTRDAAGLRTERDYIQAKGNYETTFEDRLRLMVRAARLDAEASGKDVIDVPPQIETLPATKRIVAEETAIMTTRQRKVALQLQALSELKTLLENEIVSLEKKALTQKRQMDLARQELKSIDTLADKGLVSNTRLFSSERMLADIEGRNLDLETSILRARQDISKAQQDEINVRNTLEAEIASQRQEVGASLQEATMKLDTYRALIAEALQAGVSGADGDSGPTIVYSIIRDSGGAPKEIVAVEGTAVLPGDVVKVRTLLPEPVLRVGQ
jgi:exopolysaccharide production protein ExoF